MIFCCKWVVFQVRSQYDLSFHRVNVLQDDPCEGFPANYQGATSLVDLDFLGIYSAMPVWDYAHEEAKLDIDGLSELINMEGTDFS